MAENTWEGLSNPKVWSDIDDIDAIYNLPETALHHKIDRLIQDASNDLVKTTVICPPDIYGRSAGVGSRTSFMVPMYIEALLKGKEPFYLGREENLKSVVHIDDITSLFLLLLNEAFLGGGKAQWGREVKLNLAIFPHPQTHKLISHISYTGFLLRSHARGRMERCRRGHQPARPGLKLASPGLPDGLLQRRKDEKTDPRATIALALPVGKQQSIFLRSGQAARMATQGRGFLDIYAGRRGGCG